MTRFADPTRCPDCGGRIALRGSSCPTCGLSLRGPVAQRLFQTLSAADQLLLELRASSLSPAATVVDRPALTEPVPSAVVPAASRSRLSAASVPKILLGLGAGCVLVAALVFLAVTWSALGVGGRTAALVMVTLAAGALSVSMARRDLRGAAEALALVSLGLLTLDVFGAADAGWFGNLGPEAFLVLLGTTLMLAGVGLSALLQHAPTGPLVGVQVVIGTGVLVAAVGLSDLDAGRGDVDLLATVVVAALMAEALRRLTLGVAAALAGGVAVLAWLCLVAVGVERVAGHGSPHDLWLDLEVWPLIAAAVIAGAMASVRRIPLPIRVGAASAGTAVSAYALVRPALEVTPTVTALTVTGVLVAAGALAWFAPLPWGLTAAVTQTLGGLWLAVVGLELAWYAVEHLEQVASGASDAVTGTLPTGAAPPWILLVAFTAIVGTLAAVAQASPAVDAVVGLVADLRALAASGALAVVLTVALYAPPAWVLVALLQLSAVAFLAWWLRRGSLVPLGVAAGFLAAAVSVALHDDPLTAVALAAGLACAVHVHLAADRTAVSQAAGALAAATLAALVWTTGSIAAADPAAVALVGLGLLALVGTTTFLLPASWWRSPSPVEARLGLEGGAAAAAVPVALLGVLLADPVHQAGWAAGYLTLAGAAVTATSLVRVDRRMLAWPGGALLAAASWVRLWDIGVTAPEAYTLPGAAALAVVGLRHLHTHPGSATVTALGPALSLALVPSLLWALADPDGGLRVLLLGLGCLVLVVVGVRLRWTAPTLFGSLVGGLLVLRLAAPYVGDTVPRWVVIGAAGALLIAMGVTWERRLQEARQVRAYVLGLR